MANQTANRITIPTELSGKLAGFRAALLTRQLREGLSWLVLLALGLFALTVVCDRFGDTPRWCRGLFVIAVITGIIWAIASCLRTAVRLRTPLQLARRIRQRKPDFGDDLVGALELVDDDTELARSASLCRAALDQITTKARSLNLHDAIPPTRGHAAIIASALLAVLIVVVGLSEPLLLRNTFLRLAMPWKPIPRFTFVRWNTISEELVVPRGEPSRQVFLLASETRWSPSRAAIEWGGNRIEGELIAAEADPMSGSDGGSSADVTGSQRGYRFELPAVIEPSWATLTAGDASATFRVIPKQRPHLVSAIADIQLPDYLKQHPRYRQSRSIIGNELSILDGSSVTLSLTSSSPLKRASVDGRAITPKQTDLEIPLSPDRDRVLVDWIDHDGLAASQPIEIRIKRVSDRRPTLIAGGESIPPRVLDSQSLTFDLTAEDDFSVRRVGMQWSDGEATGERVIGPKGSDSSMLAVFQATAVKAPLGDLQLRFWVEDDHPDHERVYSDPFSLTVLGPDEHAVWIAEQFAKWRLAAMDVRDRELSLFQQNRDLAKTDADQRDAEWRGKLVQQARAEELNARQLEALTREGQSLIQQAARNDQVDANDVEQLAGTIKTLQQLADEKMPSVAELLKQAAEEESKFAAMQDQESSQGVLEPSESQANSDADDANADDPANPERVGLAQTTIVDTSKRKDESKDEDDEDDKLALAIEDQTELVSEFDKVAEQLSALLGNMEGSTLVKRLKAVSRLQDRVAMRLGQTVESTFGQSAPKNETEVRAAAGDIAETSQRVRTVLDDLEALCERRNIEHFADVLAEMKESRVLDGLRKLQDEVAAKPAMSIAIAEYWADTTDRWADDLIDPRSGESKKKSGPKKSLSPEVVLEVLRVLESEVDLREQTRVAEQGREVMKPNDYMGEAIRLSEAQDLLRDRLDVIVEGLEAEPDSTLNFSAEIEILSAASAAMVDATKTLVQPETGPPALAAQTEAIELLLQSNKVTPSDSAGGGGAGEGAGGEADQAAVAMLGESLNRLAKSRQSETEIASSNSRERVPERFREGVTEYFDRLEKRLSAGESERP